MKSPFAGMDPFLEPHRLDVHHTLITFTRVWLNEHLPADLVASSEERVTIDSDQQEKVQRIGPDVRVFAPSGFVAAETSASGEILAPFKLIVDVDPVRQGFIEVRDKEGELVTVIEFLSPSNKRGEGMQDYRRRREELLAAGVRLVEIDLVRGGSWRKLLSPARVPVLAISPYRAIVRTREGLGGFVFPITFESPSPDITIPLRENDKLIKLPLQTLIHQTYESGRYNMRLDYSNASEFEFSDDEMRIISNVLKA